MGIKSFFTKLKAYPRHLINHLFNHALFVRIARLEKKIVDLEADKTDLALLLETTVQHADVIEDELMTATKTAEEAVRAKAQFLANMSHEIRTPMNGVIGMTDILLNMDLTVEQRDYINTIRSSGEVLVTLINDILDFSKIEAGKLELEYHIFELRSCIEDSLELLASNAADKGLNLAYFIEQDMPKAFIGDSTRIRQILVNLVSNAIKFTHNGEVIVSVSGYIVNQTEKEQYQKYKLHFSIQDTGIGISKDQQEKLFQAFTQIDISTTRKYGGTGLGLTISKKLVNLMEGKIWLESEVDKGSVFHFTLILPSMLKTTSDAHLYRLQPQLFGKRILISSPYAINRIILHQQVDKWGMLTHTVKHIQSALEAAQNNIRWDMAILEVPALTQEYLILINKLKQIHQPTPPSFILLMPVCTFEHNHQDFAKCISKPIRPAKLYNALISTLSSNTISAPIVNKIQEEEIRVQRKKLRILIAEDNLVNQKVAALMLKNLGYHADIVGNGLDALDMLENQHYDVIFMDVQMPEMDGLATTRQIRQKTNDMSKPWIIAMTANAMEGDKEICLNAGMNDYVSKPVRVEELATVMANYIDYESYEEKKNAQDSK